MSLYHSESQLSSLPQRQDAMHVVSIQEEQTGHSAKRGREGGRDKHTLLRHVHTRMCDCGLRANTDTR